MIVTRFALPVRSPTPFIVPWTCVAPASTAASELATPHAAVVVAVDADRAAAERGDDLAVASAIWSGSDEPFVSHRTTRSAPAVDRGAQAAQRVLAVVAPAVEEVLGVVDDALALRRRGTRPTRRSSRGSPRDRRGRPSRGAGPTSCRRSCRPARSSRRARAAPGRRRRSRRAGASSRTRRSARSRSARARAARRARLLGVRRREAGLDEVDAELVERVRDAQLLGGGQGHALALHAVAQGGVVELDHRTRRGAPAPGRATRGSARCGRAARPRTPSGPRG